MYTVTEERFNEMVNAALDQIPDPFARQMRNLAILVRDYNEDGRRLLGLYVGVPLPEQQHNNSGHLPDTIFIYKREIEGICHSEQEVADQVKVTVFHEVGHYFGLSEERLHELGWG